MQRVAGALNAAIGVATTLLVVGCGDVPVAAPDAGTQAAAPRGFGGGVPRLPSPDAAADATIATDGAGPTLGDVADGTTDAGIDDVPAADTGDALAEDAATPPDAAPPPDVAPPPDAATPPDATEPEPDGAPLQPGWDMNLGYIGGTCADDLDCVYTGGFCLDEASGGPPGGICTLDCDLYCPDKEGMVTTYCVDPIELGTEAPEGLCTARCHFGPSPTGCRPGFVCVPLPRHNDPDTVVYACVPGQEGGFVPGPCHEELIARGVGFAPAINPLDHPEGHPELLCDVVDAVRVDPVIHGVTYRYSEPDGSTPTLFGRCALALALEQTAALLADQGVTDVLHWGTYNCRLIKGTSKLSQHGLGNAIDVRGLVMGTGEVYTVLDHWEKDTAFPVTEPGAFLKWFVETLHELSVFHIILTPDYNAAHANHFHMDLTPGKHVLK